MAFLFDLPSVDQFWPVLATRKKTQKVVVSPRGGTKTAASSGIPGDAAVPFSAWHRFPATRRLSARGNGSPRKALSGELLAVAKRAVWASHLLPAEGGLPGHQVMANTAFDFYKCRCERFDVSGERQVVPRGHSRFRPLGIRTTSDLGTALRGSGSA